MSEDVELVWGRIHGRANDVLTPEFMASLGGALGTVLGEREVVVMSRDNYPPARMLKRAFSAGLMSTGVTVIDFHAATLPELVFAIKRLGAKAGVHFTISPLEWHSVVVKIFDSQGIDYPASKTSELLDRARRGHVVRSLPNRIGWVTYAEYIHDIYSAAVVGYVDAASISSAQFKVVCDVNFGAAMDVFPNIFSEVGVEAVFFNSHRPPPNRHIRHMPSPSSIDALARMVEAARANMGAALCADATRALIVDDRGVFLTPEELASLLIMGLPKGSRVAVLEPMGNAVDKVAASREVKLTRVDGTRTDLLRAARRVNASLAVTGEGAAAFLDFSPSFDGMLTVIKVLELISKRGEPLSALRESLPRPQLVTRELPVKEPDLLLPTIHRRWPTVVTMMGARVYFDEQWVDLRVTPDGFLVSVEAGPAAQEKLERICDELLLMARGQA